MDLYPHKSGLGLIEPVAQINQNVGILFGNAWTYRRVTYLEPIPPFQFLNIGAIAAQQQSNQTAATNLDGAPKEFVQMRWWVIDNAQVRMWLPSGDGRYRLLNIMSVVDMMTPVYDPCLHLTEFFEWENQHPFFVGINFSDYALTQCRLMGMGFRFKVSDPYSPEKPKDNPNGLSMVEKFEQGILPCTRVVCQGIG